MSLVAILTEERLRAELTRLAGRAGFATLETGGDPVAALGSPADPDTALIVTEAWHQDWFPKLDRKGLRYWLLAVGSPAGPSLRPPARRPHRHLLGLDRNSAAYLRQLLDDWRDRRLVRVDCFNFAFRDGLPSEADWVLDTRFLDSPYWVRELRERPGDDPEVRRYVMNQPGAERMVAGFVEALSILLPLYQGQRRSVVRVAVGCTGGRHRSLAVASEIVDRLAASGLATGRLLPRPPRHLPQALD